MTLHRCLAFVFFLFTAAGAQAQSFAVNLGDRTLGTMTFQRNGDALQLRSSLNNTPLNLFNGTLDASSRPVRLQTGEVRRQLLALSDTTRKNRQVSILFDRGVVTDVVINPTSEKTAVSGPAQVPQGVLDPVSAFGQIVSSQGCPDVMQIYDGRRVVRLATSQTTPIANGVRCDVSYQVIAGPGHLAPLSFKNASVSLRYDAMGLSSLSIATGPFVVSVVRMN